METLTHLPRRLTKLYSDTKHAGVAAAIEQDKSETAPELSAINRKFRIQKDRLLAWGLEWSDNSTSSKDDIEEEVTRAGLTETVTSVLATIKDIYEEAERMQSSVGCDPDDTTNEKSPSATDRSRYEDLARDLTSSVDILYELSRSRRALRQGTYPQTPLTASTEPSSAKTAAPQPIFMADNYSASEVTLVNPIQGIPHKKSFGSLIPPKLDPKTLILPEEEPPPYDSISAHAATRLIGHLRETHTSTNPWKVDGGKTVGKPVLVEYAAYDPVFSQTGVSPPLDRLDAVLTFLTGLESSPSPSAALRCLGYFEDLKQPRFGIVYELPTFVYAGPSTVHNSWNDLRPTTLFSLLQSSKPTGTAASVPALEDRFRLAFNLTQTFYRMHSENIWHKDVSSSNILVFRKNHQFHPAAAPKPTDFNLRTPYIASFDVFSEYRSEQAAILPNLNIYRHPDDPVVNRHGRTPYGAQFDLFSLGLVLLEIGLWIPICDIFKPKYSLEDFKTRLENIFIKRLAAKCGTPYMQAVRDCILAADRMASGTEPDHTLNQIYSQILIRLRKCCLLDEEFSTDANLFVSAAGSSYAMPTKGSEPSIKPSTTLHSIASRGLKRLGSVKKSHASESLRTLPRLTPPIKTPPAEEVSISPLSAKLTNPFSRSQQALPLSPRIGGEYRKSWDGPAPEGVLGGWRPALAQSTTHLALRDDRQDFHGQDRAASIIQRAWRNHREKLNFHDYRRKVTVVQNQWRFRKSGTESQNNLLQEESQEQSREDLGASVATSQNPEVEAISSTFSLESTIMVDSSIRIETCDISPRQTTPKPKIRIVPSKFPPSLVDDWHQTMLPRLERIIERTLKDSPETVSIDLLAVEIAPGSIRPTIFITCTSTTRVRAVLHRKFNYNREVFDMKVRKGKVRRSKMNKPVRRRPPPHRSMMNDDICSDGPALNPFHQQRPLCGASIGAFRGQHLPPVSYGGIVLVDGAPFGMSVHHLLDAPSEDEDTDYGEDRVGDTTRSSAQNTSSDWLAGMGSQPSLQFSTTSFDEALEISDYEESDIDAWEGSVDDFSDDELSDAESEAATEGDIDGVDPGDGDDIIITQPALDDVDDDFFPSLDDRDEDHLDSHSLGYVHASSGIRRWKRDDIVHEIDWALLKLNEDRIQPYNLVQGGKRFCRRRLTDELCPKLVEPVCRRNYSSDEDEYPNQVARTDALGGLNVHCFGRTSGLKGGKIGVTMSSLRIYKRKSFSRSWHVVGSFGIGGDSGAWVMDNERGRVCGHVLAWCEKNKVAYICPMEVLLEDIRRTLGAHTIDLPGSIEAENGLNDIDEDQNIFSSGGGGVILGLPPNGVPSDENNNVNNIMRDVSARPRSYGVPVTEFRQMGLHGGDQAHQRVLT